jgi:hypothetical protein
MILKIMPEQHEECSMILPEVLKKLYDLQIKMRDNGGARIEDIASAQDSDYGYITVLTSFKGNIHDDVLAAKLLELNGKKFLPDLWIFGPLLRKQEPVQMQDKQ